MYKGIGPSTPTDDPTQGTEQRVRDIDGKILTPIVRAVVDDRSATLTDWSYEPIYGGVGGGYGGTTLYRFSGRAQVDQETIAWSVVLKILAERRDEPATAVAYWRREVEFYRSSIPTRLHRDRSRLVPARLYEFTEFPGESVWLWLEDVSDEFDGDWSLSQYGRTATHLGEFGGYFLTHDLLTTPWLGARPFDFERVASLVAELDGEVEDLLLGRLFPADVRRRHAELWEARFDYWDRLTSLPRTVCHFDAFERNLFARRDRTGWETVAIDWNRVGHGAVGEDAAALTFLSLLFDEVDPSEAAALDAAVFDGYLDGLCAAGWDDDRAKVRLGYLLHLALRWLEWTGPGAQTIRDPDKHAFLEQTLDQPIEAVRTHFERVNRAVVPFVDELASLAKSSGARNTQ
jgi:hypothetical protein